MMSKFRILESLIMFAFLIVLTFSLLSSSFAIELHGENEEYVVDIRIRPSVGYRQDNLNWNVGDSSGEFPNIYSELEFNDMEIYQAGLDADIVVNQVYLRASFHKGVIMGGESIDSDYDDDNREDLWSKSVSEVNDDNTSDLSAGAGYVFSFFNKRLNMAPLLGVSYHKQNLRLTKGRQIVLTKPGEVDFRGFNSTYQTEWSSSWVGMDLNFKATPSLLLSLSSEYHDADYEAKADWNLRSEYAHPVSYVHYADGRGTILKAGIEKIFRKHWKIGLNYIRQDWSTDAGTDTIFLATGAIVSSRLNEVNWESETLSLSFGYRF